MRQNVREVGFDGRHKRINRQVRDDDRLRNRHELRQKKRKRQMMTMRSVMLFLLCVALVFIILFMTPLFNIRRITVSGNYVISLDEINNRIGYLNGTNLLKANENDVRSKLEGIAYIKSVDVEKDYFKTTLKVNVVEREACGYLGFSGKYVLFDDECVILAETNERPEDIPLIVGVGDSEDEKELLKMSEENIKVMVEALKLMRELGILADIDRLDLSDESNIRFKYQDRLDVECGSDIDIDRKLRLFEAIVHNDNLAQNAQGTVDLSVTGNARYSPERTSSTKSADTEKISKKEN